MNRLHQWYCRSKMWTHRLQNEVLPWTLEGICLGDDVLELGPGPGLATEWLRRQCRHLTCIELDPELAKSLLQRLINQNVTVQLGDATAMPFRDEIFSCVLSFTMLHHVLSPDLQNRLFAEAHRVLKPGGVFARSDTTWSLPMWAFHLADTLVTIDPKQLPARLRVVGFEDVAVDTHGDRFRFRAKRSGYRGSHGGLPAASFLEEGTSEA